MKIKLLSERMDNVVNKHYYLVDYHDIVIRC